VNFEEDSKVIGEIQKTIKKGQLSAVSDLYKKEPWKQISSSFDDITKEYWRLFLLLAEDYLKNPGCDRREIVLNGFSRNYIVDATHSSYSGDRLISEMAIRETSLTLAEHAFKIFVFDNKKYECTK